jgi:hypothetical protein
MAMIYVLESTQIPFCCEQVLIVLRLTVSCYGKENFFQPEGHLYKACILLQKIIHSLPQFVPLPLAENILCCMLHLELELHAYIPYCVMK